MRKIIATITLAAALSAAAPASQSDSVAVYSARDMRLTVIACTAIGVAFGAVAVWLTLTQPAAHELKQATPTPTPEVPDAP